MNTSRHLKKLLCSLFLALALVGNAAIDHWETVVYESDTWRYLTPTSSVPPTWIDLSFNDASWLTGNGGFGYGDGDDNTTIPSTVSCYQRIIFNIVDVSAIESIIFNLDYDDGFVAYLNGIEIARDNFTNPGQPNYDQLTNTEHEAVMYQGGYPSTTILDQAFVQSNLINGANILCIQVHNSSVGSSDLTSRAFLTLGINNTSTNYGTPPSWFTPPFVFTDSNLPIVIIETENSAIIPDEPEINGTMGIIYNGVGIRNYVSDPFNEYSGNIGIEVRGSSSQMFPKKQWNVETRDINNQRLDVSIFNMAFDNDWVLYAPYTDKTLIRDILAFEMGRDLGSYAPRTQLCEVVLNGQYEGVYVFIEKIKRKDDKVGTNDVQPTDVFGNELTGDYILKIDKATGNAIIAWDSPFPPYSGASQTIGFQFHDPSYDSLNATQRAYVQDYITDFETALNGPNFADPIFGYASLIDVKSFVNLLLINEASHNVDGYRISSFLHKIRASEGGKLFAGPLWDFNLAFGNADYCDGSNTIGWETDFYQVCGGDGWQNPFWWNRLLEDPEFNHITHCTWLEMRAGAWHNDSIFERIDSFATYLGESQSRNFQRWPILGSYVWPNNFVGNTYQEEIDYLKTWISARFTWMDANMHGSCDDLSLNENSSNHILVSPNPTNAIAQFSFNTFLENAQLELSDVNGKVVLTSPSINGESHQIDVSALQSGMYLYTITSDSERFTGKLMKHL